MVQPIKFELYLPPWVVVFIYKIPQFPIMRVHHASRQGQTLALVTRVGVGVLVLAACTLLRLDGFPTEIINHL